MISYHSLFVLVGVFQAITSQGPPGWAPRVKNIPDKCKLPPPGVEYPAKCCHMKPMYTEDEMFGCESTQTTNNRIPCFMPLCLLTLRRVIVNNHVDFPKFEEFLRNWSKDGPFNNTVEIALKICAQPAKVPGPPQICEPARLMHCVGGYLFAHCPEKNWLQTDSCKAMKKHMKDCKRI